MITSSQRTFEIQGSSIDTIDVRLAKRQRFTSDAMLSAQPVVAPKPGLQILTLEYVIA